MAIGEVKVNVKASVRFKWLLIIVNYFRVMFGFKVWMPKWAVKCELVK